MKKRIVSFLLAMCMLSTVAAASGGPYNNYNNLVYVDGHAAAIHFKSIPFGITGKGQEKGGTYAREYWFGKAPDED